MSKNHSLPPLFLQARRYLEQLPRKSVPIAGSGGARFRKLQLERQFPVHDVEPDECHELTDAEVQR